MTDLLTSIAHKLAYELLKAGGGRLRALAVGDAEQQAPAMSLTRPSSPCSAPWIPISTKKPPNPST